MRFVSDDKKRPEQAPNMQVLGVGLSRCATSSLQAAFESEVIGMGPSMHMAHVLPHADREQMVIDALNLPEFSPARLKILHRLFDGYAATTDFPGWAFAAELMDMYPDAAVVLNRRVDGRVWADSITHSHRFFGKLRYLVMCYLWRTDRLHYRIHRTSYRVCSAKFGTTQVFSPEFYDAHNRWVREEAAKRGKQVLEWTPGDGWVPLCEFLGKEPPKDGRPFPHLNDAAAFDTVKKIIIARGLISWAALGLAAWGAYRYLLPKVLG